VPLNLHADRISVAGPARPFKPKTAAGSSTG
jgi:hypothetical protein